MALGLMALAWGALLPMGSPGFLIMGLFSLVCGALLPAGGWPWHFMVFTLPFLAFGSTSAYLYRRLSSRDHKDENSRISGPLGLYLSETLGFALGMGLLGPLFMDSGNPIFCGFTAAALCLWCYISFGRENRSIMRLSGLVLCLALVLSSSAVFEKAAPLFSKASLDTQSHLASMASERGVDRLETFWSSMARTDLLIPRHGAMSFIYTDGMFCSRIPVWDGQTPGFQDRETHSLSILKRLPFRILSAGPSVMLAGAAGGFDIAVARQEGASKIWAVEVNPRAMQITREFFPYFSGVETPLAEVRGWLESKSLESKGREQEKFDLLLFSLMETWAGGELGRAHLHTRLFTLEAARLYLDSCRSGGCVAVIQNTSELASRTMGLFARAMEGRKGLVAMVGAPAGDKSTYNPFSFLVMALPAADGASSAIINRRAQELKCPPPLIRSFDGVGDSGSEQIDVPSDWRPFFYARRGDSLPLAAACAAALIAGMAMILGGKTLETIMRIRRGREPLAAETSAPRETVGSGIRAFLLGAGAMGFQGCLLYWAMPLAGNPATAWKTAFPLMLAGAGIGSRLPLFFPCLARDSFWGRATLMAGLWGGLSTILILPFFAGALGLQSFPELMRHTLANPTLLALLALVTFLPLGLPFALLLARSPRPGVIIAADGLGMVFGSAACAIVSMEMGYGWVGAISALAYFMAAPGRESTLSSEAP